MSAEPCSTKVGAVIVDNAARRSPLATIAAICRAKPAALIDRVGPCMIRPKKDRFGTLVRAIIGQQISVSGARTVTARVVASLGLPAGPDGRRLFPTPEALADAADADLPDQRKAELVMRCEPGRIELGAQTRQLLQRILEILLELLANI